MVNILEHSDGIVDYTMYTPNITTTDTIMFIPGMACNRFGNPSADEPLSIVKDIVETAQGSYNIVFPDINQTSRAYSKGNVLIGDTIENQNQRLLYVIDKLSKLQEVGDLTFIAQSIGCLVIAKLAGDFSHSGGVSILLLGPPTYDGLKHRLMLISKFSKRELTNVDDKQEGQLEFGEGKLLMVSPQYWESIDNNSIKRHYSHLMSFSKDITAFCASRDHFYPNNAEYLHQYAPQINRVEIDGDSHTFKTDDMRNTLKKELKKILIDSRNISGECLNI